MNSTRLKKSIFIIILLAAIASIAIGIQRAWISFMEFDDTILKEKDQQYYGILKSDDISVENSIESFTREAESFFARKVLEQYREEWANDENRDVSKLEEYFKTNTLTTNPIYSDMMMTSNDSVVASASGNHNYKFLTSYDARGFRLAENPEGKFTLVYEYDAGGKVRYDAVIDLANLYMNAITGEASGDLMLIDSTSTIMVRKQGADIVVERTDAAVDDNSTILRDFMLQCQKNQNMDSESSEFTDGDGKTYAARVVTLPSEETVNKEFAIGIGVNYEAAAGPSRAAAKKLMIYGGVAVSGIAVLVFLLILLRRVNAARDTELENLKKRNETVELINQKMVALTHHQRLETIGTMTASIAHEFNNLLTPIMGYSIMCMEMLPADATDIQENLLEVYNASMKAKDIVKRLSDLSKKGKEEDFQDLNPNEIIRNAMKITLPAKPKNVDVKGSFSASKSLIKGDSTQLSQLVINIVLNAYDAMRECGGTLLVSTKVEGYDIALRFRDNGPGMDEETVARIFDPFYTTKESGKGTGLGLAIVAQIVDTHNGHIYVDSHPGEGTEFKITLPIIEKSSFLDRTRTIQISAEDLKKAMEKENR